MSKIGNFFKAVGLTLTRTVGGTVQGTREAVETAVNALAKDASVGELEQRFSPRRVLGGWRLARTGKHRHSSLTRHQVAARRPAGSKLWKKAAEGKL